MRRTLAAGAAVVALAGCAGGRGGDDYGVVKTFREPHGTIEVRKGAQFTVELEVNAGVGFDWRLIPFRVEGARVRAQGSTTAYPDDNPRPGESGATRFDFVAAGAGRQTLVFQHVFRGKPRERRLVVVLVRPS